MVEKLLLIDASSSIFRAFYALPHLANARGVPTNATLGFTSMLQKLLRDTQPDYVVVVWDAPGPKRRKQISPDYKATRDATPEDLRAQFPQIREIVAAYGLATAEYEGEEADDVIATLTRRAEPLGMEVLIASSDKDLMQLVGERVTLLDTMKDQRIGPAEVEARFGVAPARMLDLRALTGDPSDNIPGVRGIGQKTAASLIAQFGWIRRAVGAYGLAAMEYEGEEADDVIATLTRQALGAGFDVEIVSTDKDLMQLVSDRVTLLDTAKDRRIGPAEVIERFGVPPEQILDLRALIGDTSDNIPGVKGIGAKGAVKLMNEFGSLDAILDNAGQVKAKRAREALLAHADDARLSRELSRLREDLPLEFDPERAKIPEPDVDSLGEIFRELELRRLLEGLGDAAAPPPVPVQTIPTELLSGLDAIGRLVKDLERSARLAVFGVLEPAEPMTGELVGIALAESAERAWFVPCGEPGMLDALRGLLERGDLAWTGFGLKRLCVALARRGIELRGELRDSSLAAYVLDPSQQVQRLDALARRYLDRELRDSDEVSMKLLRWSGVGCRSSIKLNNDATEELRQAA